jgi:hypothetical protein
LGCSGEPAPGVVLPVVLHTRPSCDVPAALESGSIELVALGDFAASNQSAEVLSIDPESGDAPAGTPLRFPPETRALEARLAGRSVSFRGYGERSSERRFDVLLWPELTTCSLFRPDGALGYPGKRGGQALGFSRARGALVAAGGNDPLVSDAIRGAAMLDVATGEVTTVDTSQDWVLREARAFATLTELGSLLVIAGGEDPALGVPEDDRAARDTAELFDPELGRFTGELIELSGPRTHHAAVSTASGDTWLIGGRSLRIDDEVIGAQLVEVISSETRRSITKAAVVERIDPRAVMLDDGRVFIGSGTDGSGHVVSPSCEWLSPDAREVSAADCMPPRFDRALWRRQAVACSRSAAAKSASLSRKTTPSPARAAAAAVRLPRATTPGGSTARAR